MKASVIQDKDLVEITTGGVSNKYIVSQIEDGIELNPINPSCLPAKIMAIQNVSPELNKTP